MKIYNKLVRDRIPEIIEADGKTPKVRILSEAEYKTSLLEKLVEEAKEALATKGDQKELAKEIGDIQEVIDASVEAFKLDRSQIETLKQKRKTDRGGFEKKLFLESTK